MQKPVTPMRSPRTSFMPRRAAAGGPPQLAGLVGIRRDLAVVEVRGEGYVPFARVPLGHVLDVVVEPPPLLDHDHRRRRPRALRLRQIRPDPVPVPHELDRVAHYGPSFLILTAPPRRSSASRTVMWNRPTLNSSPIRGSRCSAARIIPATVSQSPVGSSHSRLSLISWMPTLPATR